MRMANTIDEYSVWAASCSVSLENQGKEKWGDVVSVKTSGRTAFPVCVKDE